MSVNIKVTGGLHIEWGLIDPKVTGGLKTFFCNTHHFFVPLSHLPPSVPPPPPPPLPQHSVHVSLRAAGPEGLLRGAAAHLPHPLHRGAGLHQRHGDLHHLGRRGRVHGLGPAGRPQDGAAGQHPARGAEQRLRRVAAAGGASLARRALMTPTLRGKDTWKKKLELQLLDIKSHTYTHTHTHSHTHWCPSG